MLAGHPRKELGPLRSTTELRFLLLPLVLSIGLLGGAVAPASAAVVGPAPIGGPFGILRPAAPPSSADEERVVDLVNAERALAGLPPLTRQAGLASAASDYATAMADRGLFSHTSPDGSSLQDRGEAHGYLGWTFLGENLAAGQDTPERVVRAWMASSTHRANVLSAQACDIGVGRATARGAGYHIYWVMEIGCGLFSS
jgi:uncharacterized protein YkwD